ncbi:LSU ribosomal protein L10p (P0) [Fulvivirga imtechensis AK7]|uniref:Large ribosomal subunit protein uL10 n=1 Tax=Fulvivirga imtechensis AK7 TaxID=1237149 RepID=L8JL82_9BACT|nr:50S ribosomal protein L10 [Fulvivirga imtechensis]ELR69696.1 LSU ribosomal protein L10p (P0) [Fulvivirga imtechensis AK7]
MTRQEKANIIEALTEKFNNNPHFYITDASGLSVAQVNAFRKVCYDRGVEYGVYKNTLIKKALSNVDGDFSALDESLKGFSGVVFSNETANLPAKVITEYRKKQGAKKPLLKAASIDKDFFIGEENLKMLSELKSKNELIGDVIALLQSPAKNVLSALQSGKHTIGGLVKALAER